MNRPPRGWLARSFALAVAASTCIVVVSPASATIWRCGNSYSDTPCAGATTIEAPAEPSAQQQRQAYEGMRNDQKAARQMQRERMQLEAKAAGQGAVIIGHPQKATAAPRHEAPTLSAPKKPKTSKGQSAKRNGDFVAMGEAQDHKPRKKKSKTRSDD